MNNTKVDTRYYKTELILSNYINIKKGIENREKTIESIKKYGTPQTSKSIILHSGSNYSYSYETATEKNSDAIEKIQKSIETTRSIIKLVDSAINAISNDIYFNIIRLKYFENKTLEQIAEIMHCDASTVSRNKKRLVEQLSVILFPDDMIKDLGMQ